MLTSDLVRRCLAGDQSAWGALLDQYAGLVYAIARAHGLDEPTCDDVAQVVFSGLARRLADVREPDALAGWLSTTAKRECWRVLAARRREQELPEQETGPSVPPEQRLREIESVQRVREALVELGGRCQRLLTALFLTAEPPDYRAIADSLGMPVGSIGPTRSRCLAKLAEILGQSWL